MLIIRFWNFLSMCPIPPPSLFLFFLSLFFLLHIPLMIMKMGSGGSRRVDKEKREEQSETAPLLFPSPIIVLPSGSLYRFPVSSQRSLPRNSLQSAFSGDPRDSWDLFHYNLGPRRQYVSAHLTRICIARRGWYRKGRK